MLDKFTQQDLEMIKRALEAFWGKDCVIDNIEVIDVPVPMFEMKFTLYNYAKLMIEYDRGTVGIRLKINDEYKVLSRLTDKKIYWGFEGCNYENLQHNFAILDEIVRKQISQA